MDDEGSVRGEDSGASLLEPFLLSGVRLWFARENDGLLKKSVMGRIMGI